MTADETFLNKTEGLDPTQLLVGNVPVSLNVEGNTTKDAEKAAPQAYKEPEYVTIEQAQFLQSQGEIVQQAFPNSVVRTDRQRSRDGWTWHIYADFDNTTIEYTDYFKSSPPDGEAMVEYILSQYYSLAFVKTEDGKTVWIS